MQQEQGGAELPELEDIGLAAVLAELQTLANAVAGVAGDVERLTAEICKAKPELQEDHEVISEALGITKEDNDFFQVQANTALRRNNDKLTAIIAMLTQLGAKFPEELMRSETPVDSHRPRAVPEIRRTRNKNGRTKLRLNSRAKLRLI
jgi:ABC-type transporter Mla subunit MlaD